VLARDIWQGKAREGRGSLQCHIPSASSALIVRFISHVPGSRLVTALAGICDYLKPIVCRVS